MHQIDEIRQNLPDLEVHPSNTTPWMTPEKHVAVKNDILQAGRLYIPIWMRDGMIFDGKSRYKILQELKAEGKLNFAPKILEWKTSDDDAEGVFDSLNIQRNQFGSNQMAAYIAMYRIDQLKIEARERMLRGKKLPIENFPEGSQGTAYEIAATLYGSNEKYIRDALKIKNKNENLLEFVMKRQMSIEEGLAYIKLNQDQRDFVYGKMKTQNKYRDALQEYMTQTQSSSSNGNLQKNTKSSTSKLRDVPSIIFTFPVDADFADEISSLFANRYEQATTTYEVWDVKGNEKLTAKINSISQAVAKGSGDK